MRLKQLFYNAEVVQGRGESRDLKQLTPMLYQRVLKQYEPGEKVVVTVEDCRPRRSNQQNRYYWLYLTTIANETGDNENDLHEYLKRTCLPPRYLRVLGQEVKLPASTTDLSKSDFAEYIMRIHSLTHVPPPDPEAAGFAPNNKRYY